MTESPKHWTEEAADAILKALSDRKGIGQELQNIDDDILDEIRDEIVDTISEHSPEDA
jgi:hypothetical protein